MLCAGRTDSIIYGRTSFALVRNDGKMLLLHYSYAQKTILFQESIKIRHLPKCIFAEAAPTRDRKGTTRGTVKGGGAAGLGV